MSNIQFPAAFDGMAIVGSAQAGGALISVRAGV